MMHYPASGKAAHRRLHTPFQADTPYKNHCRKEASKLCQMQQNALANHRHLRTMSAVKLICHVHEFV